MLQRWLQTLPLVAILRGIQPQEAEAIGRALSGVGFRMLEVPLNSPDPMESIRILVATLGDDHLVGAGTVMTPQQVDEVAAAGGRLVVMPHADVEVIRAAKAARLLCTPGVATPTEAIHALQAGADALKLFPAGQLGPSTLAAWRAVLPPDTNYLPVGGIHADNMAPWVAAGARGFGIGSALYRSGMAPAEVARRGRTFADAWAQLAHPTSTESRA